MTDCLFCKIVRRELPAAVVYEDDDMFAFLDIRPTTEGHTLVIPKRHYDGFAQTPPDEVSRLMAAVRIIAPSVIAAVDAPAFNVHVNAGKEAGQVIFHTHVHIIPRRADDGLRLWPGMEMPEERMASIATRIRQGLGE